jgi:hypothetical protein
MLFALVYLLLRRLVVIATGSSDGPAQRHRGSRPSPSAVRSQATGGPAATSPQRSAVPRSGKQSTPSSALVCLPGQPADAPSLAP